MAKIYNLQIFPVGINAVSTEQSGYPANNILRSALARPYRAQSANAGVGVEYAKIDLGSDLLIRGVLIHDCNCVSVRVDTTTAAASTTFGTGQSSVTNKHGRYRALAQKNIVGRYITINPYGGTNDGLSYYRIGAVYIFGGVYSSQMPNYGLQINTLFPTVGDVSVNGRDASALLSNFPVDRLSGEFELTSNQSIGNLLQDLRNGVCCLDVEDILNPAKIWPLRITAKEIDEKLDVFDQSMYTFKATEQC